MQDTDLSYADLSYADLSYSDMQGADLTMANIHAIKEEKTIWSKGAKLVALKKDKPRENADKFEEKLAKEREENPVEV